MTTTVTVQAHCPADTEVVIVKGDPDAEVEPRETHVLQDGQSWSGTVWGEDAIGVFERKKE